MMNRTKFIVFILAFGFSFLSAQTEEKKKKDNKARERANNFVYEANDLASSEDYVAAEMEYRRAISESPKNVAGAYNLAHAYYKKGSFDEALFRSQEAAKNAKTKEEKHKAYHSIGNILMKNEMCKEAVEAYKNALRSNPNDDETRYNLALAKDCAKQDGGGEDNKEDKKDDKKEDEKKDKDGKDKEEKKDEEGDKDKKEGEDEEDENGKPKDEKQDQGKGDKDKKKQKQKPKPGQMSPQQIKNILDAMQNQEQKVQKKINAEKQKGAKVKTEKDW